MDTEPFMGEIGIAAFNFAPQGWTKCNGGTLPINQNQALFSLLSTKYGGNGTTTFGLPDLRGRVAIHQGPGFTMGQNGGEEAHTVTIQQMPSHIHFLSASKDVAQAGTASAGNVLGQSSGEFLYGPPGNFLAMASPAVQNAGGSQPHENRQPFTVVNFCICLAGVFPSQTPPP